MSDGRELIYFDVTHMGYNGFMILADLVRLQNQTEKKTILYKCNFKMPR